MDVAKMSGAELKVQLTGLGLTPVWFAHQLGVTPRTVIRWFDAELVPAYAAAELGRVSAMTDDAVSAMIREIADDINWGGDGVIRTERTDVQKLNTLPATWRRALAFRVLNYLRHHDYRVTVAYT